MKQSITINTIYNLRQNTVLLSDGTASYCEKLSSIPAGSRTPFTAEEFWAVGHAVLCHIAMVW